MGTAGAIIEALFFILFGPVLLVLSLTVNRTRGVRMTGRRKALVVIGAVVSALLALAIVILVVQSIFKF